MSESDRKDVCRVSSEMMRAVLRASERSSAAVHEEMKEGLMSLATSATIAPWLGIFATVVGIPNSFIGCAGEKSACMATTVERLSGSIWPTAMGLLVGLASLWCYTYLAGRLATFEREMGGARLELVNQLARHRGRWILGPRIERISDRPMFGEKSLAELRQDERFWYRSMFLTSATLLMAWCLQVVRYFDHDSLPLNSAVWTACEYVLFVFGLSCLAAHALWVRLLHRRRGGLALLAATCCLSWCIAELLLGVHLL